MHPGLRTPTATYPHTQRQPYRRDGAVCGVGQSAATEGSTSSVIVIGHAAGRQRSERASPGVLLVCLFGGQGLHHVGFVRTCTVRALGACGDV